MNEEHKITKTKLSCTFLIKLILIVLSFIFSDAFEIKLECGVVTNQTSNSLSADTEIVLLIQIREFFKKNQWRAHSTSVE